MLKKVRNKINNIGLTRFTRIRNYVKILESKYEVESMKELNSLKELKNIIDDRISKLREIYIISAILYFAIYISVFSFFFSNLFFISDFVKFISEIISFFGTFVFLIILFFVNRLKELYYSDLLLLSAHVISIYNRYEPYTDTLFDDSNEYNSFLSYFRSK